MPRLSSRISSGSTLARLRLTPTTVQDFLATGVTDPYVPTDFSNGAQSVIHVRASTFNSELRSLPTGTEGDICVLVHAGDGGTVTDQTGILTLRHMYATYDEGVGGDASTYSGFYLPGQRDIKMMPAECAIFRMDTGHKSWRMIAKANSGRELWNIANQISFAYESSVSPAALSSGDNDLLSPTGGQLASVWRLDAHASGSNVLGMIPPLTKHWNGSAYKAHRDIRVLYNRGGGGSITLKMNASASAEYKFVCDSLSDVVIPVWGSRLCVYEPEHNFWLVLGKP